MGPIQIIEINEVDSTNSYLKSLLTKNNLPEGYVVLAESQIGGKGLGTNVWESEPGKNLTFSLLVRPEFLKAEEMFLLSKAISLGIIDSLNSLKDCFTIKWPNDIYYQNKKVGGILIENQIQGDSLKHSIIGIGININQDVFTGNAPNPISLKQILCQPLNNKDILKNILDQISIWYDMLADGYTDKINEQYFSHLFRNTDYHDFKTGDEIFHAKIQEVAVDGQLILKAPTGEIRKFYLKEVEFVF
jgi:BirA family biotin operon repressor/biotin-[acetyl-CoA-carboxylase] ligase